MSAPRAPADVDRLLRHAARQEVDRLEQHHEPVEPGPVAERVVYAYHHLTAVRAQLSLARLVIIRLGVNPKWTTAATPPHAMTAPSGVTGVGSWLVSCGAPGCMQIHRALAMCTALALTTTG